MNGELQFYLRLMSRRFPAMAALFMLAASIGVVIALRLPTIYSTKATLLVEASQISDKLVRGLIEVDPTEQLDVIQQRLMTRANLLDVARKNRLFVNEPDMNPDDIVAKMRASTRVRNTSGRNRATVMTITFTGEDPRKAAAVVGEYVTIVLSTNAGLRAQSVGGTLEFFEQEVTKLTEDLDLQAEKIVAFKNANADALPENLAYRQGRQTLLQDRLSRAERDLEALQTQRENIERIYASAETLRPNSGIRLSPEQEQLNALKSELNIALGIYSEENPKIKLLRNRITTLEAQIVGTPSADGEPAASPQATALDISLAELNAQMETLRQDVTNTSEQLAVLEESIQRTPVNRINLEAMEREQENIRNLYSAAVERLAQARMGERIELSSKGERISVLESASVPRTPSGPNRVKVAGLGVVAGLGLAAGLFVLLELLNQSIRRPTDILRALEITPLATLPRFETVSDRRRRRSLQLTTLVVVAVTMSGTLWATDKYYMPLDVLFEKVMDRLT